MLGGNICSLLLLGASKAGLALSPSIPDSLYLFSTCCMCVVYSVQEGRKEEGRKDKER